MGKDILKDKKLLRNAWIEINLKNLEHNIKEIKKYIGNKVGLTGIVKADGYGHGVLEIAKVLKKNGISSFGVATLEEAEQIREAGFRDEIIMLGLVPDFVNKSIVKNNIIPVICSYDSAKKLSIEAKNQNKVAEIFIVIDTGMGRIGYISPDRETIHEIKSIYNLPNIKIKGLFSHMSTSGEIDNDFSLKQIERFKEFSRKIESEGIELPVKTLGNSGAILNLEDSYFDRLRLGIAMYGCSPMEEVKDLPFILKPVMSVKSKIVFLKKVPAGFSVGYGRSFITKRESVIATLPIGYADGYRRTYSKVGKVIINNQIVPLAGTICMDQCMVDVTDISDVKLGDEVLIMGEMCDKRIMADDIAKSIGTISYEILCGFGQRLERYYKE